MCHEEPETFEHIDFYPYNIGVAAFLFIRLAKGSAGPSPERTGWLDFPADCLFYRTVLVPCFLANQEPQLKIKNKIALGLEIRLVGELEYENDIVLSRF